MVALEITNTVDIYCENEGHITRHYPSHNSNDHVCITCGHKNGLNAENEQAANKSGELDTNNSLIQQFAEFKDFLNTITMVFQESERLYDLVQDIDDIRFSFTENSVEAENVLKSFEIAIEQIDDDHRKILGIYEPNRQQAIFDHHKEEAKAGII